ncbi:hypothetical protein [Planktothrix pseudagardhii]|uniref:Uncharacterized protein n=2 Tax=Planktothrix TaxID=54304 RepID=A0A9W4CKS5_9CYAN|nr:hypothetical protein [Planktothrix pseudagardhii]CAD5932440.1 hypothetical protein NO713_01377 [Planktothrix pseudagardhii]
MRYKNIGPGEDGYDNDDHDYDYDRDVQDSYDDYREQNALDRELERDSEREMWEGNESDSDW